MAEQIIINKHELVHAEDAGNGYHGYCEHCRAPLVTDLGYVSWEGLECVDRPIELYQDLPGEVRRYAQFRGLVWDNDRKVFTKPYGDEEFGPGDIMSKINEIRI